MASTEPRLCPGGWLPLPSGTSYIFDMVHLTESQIYSAVYLTNTISCTLYAYPQVLAMLQPMIGSNDQL